jgi:hypothetical protein
MESGLAEMIGGFIDTWRVTLWGMAAPFPDTPVGIGARWTSRATLRYDNNSVLVRMDYELIRLDGERAEVKFHGETLMPPQRDGYREVFSVQLQLDGTATFERTRPLPRTAHWHGEWSRSWSTVGQPGMQHERSRFDFDLRDR